MSQGNYDKDSGDWYHWQFQQKKLYQPMSLHGLPLSENENCCKFGTTTENFIGKFPPYFPWSSHF
jgi:hypothetical protein